MKYKLASLYCLIKQYRDVFLYLNYEDKTCMLTIDSSDFSSQIIKIERI